MRVGIGISTLSETRPPEFESECLDGRLNNLQQGQAAFGRGSVRLVRMMETGAYVLGLFLGQQSMLGYGHVHQVFC